MKILKKGDAKTGQWWVGREVECTHCGQVVRLETTDGDAPNWLGNDHRGAAFACLCCGKTLQVLQEGIHS